jgi:hypothetical protein
MKRIVVLSSMRPCETYATLNVECCEDENGVHLVKLPGTLLWVCHATPLNRRLAVPFIEHADAVIIMFQQTSMISMLRARQWKGKKKKTYYNTTDILKLNI